VAWIMLSPSSNLPAFAVDFFEPLQMQVCHLEKKPMQVDMETAARISLLQKNVEKAIKGKSHVVRLAVITLLARGHLLIEDVPGVGKTTLAHSLARSLNCSFKRIQFTSDMLPSDILGVSVYNPIQKEFEFKSGPIFSNVVLADEINRTSPKTQSSLLEAMNEFQVSIDKETYPLPRPFIVIATQNPLEYQGTFPLPESQLDRFMMRIRIGYPQIDDEKEILKAEWPGSPCSDLAPVLSVEEVLHLQEMVDTVRMDESLMDYILHIVGATRSSKNLEVGASPRGGLFLMKASKAMAVSRGRGYCIPDDIKGVAVPVLAHRVVVAGRFNFYGQRGEEAERIIQDLVESVPVPL